MNVKYGLVWLERKQLLSFENKIPMINGPVIDSESNNKDSSGMRLRWERIREANEEKSTGNRPYVEEDMGNERFRNIESDKSRGG